MDGVQLMTGDVLALERQQSFYFGGSTAELGGAHTMHADAGYAFMQWPQNAKALPLVLWHGGGQSGKTWESTPDGREGYQQLLLRHGFAVCIIDQARRGRASRSSDPAAAPSQSYPDSFYYNIFRLGTWAAPGPLRPHPGTAFPAGEMALDQFLFQVTDNAGPAAEVELMRALHADNISALLQRIGEAVLVTHSQSGQFGWASAMRRPDAVKGIVTYEPNIFAFPSDDLPPDVSTSDLPVPNFTPSQLVPPAEFEKLTSMPIQVVFGDYIRNRPASEFGSELWRRVAIRAEQFAEAVNRRGGRVEILHLPDAGLQGNSHFPFADLNNIAVARTLVDWLGRHGLAR